MRPAPTPTPPVNVESEAKFTLQYIREVIHTEWGLEVLGRSGWRGTSPLPLAVVCRQSKIRNAVPKNIGHSLEKTVCFTVKRIANCCLLSDYCT